jgi:hypothetical protein
MKCRLSAIIRALKLMKWRNSWAIVVVASDCMSDSPVFFGHFVLFLAPKKWPATSKKWPGFALQPRENIDEMALRAGHGAGAGSPRCEVLPPDEQPDAQATGPDPIAAGRDATGKVRSTAAAVALAKLPRKSKFIPRKLSCDQRFEPHNRRRLEWQRKRLAELQAAHGAVSYGVGAMVNAAAWLYAGAEFAAELAAESGDPEGFRAAGSLSSTARQHELASWELSAREAQNRPKTPAAVPWLTSGDDDSKEKP